MFARLTSYLSPTGLLSEMVDPASGALLGNYPQAFSHLGLVRAALALAGDDLER
jgi:GH15 family glucan-1,4-alpha-glucosidase